MVRTVVLLFIILIPFTAYPQKRKAQKAYDAWEAGEYFEAIDFFKDAYSKTRDRNEKSENVTGSRTIQLALNHGIKKYQAEIMQGLKQHTGMPSL